jgi:hypothetical protein
MRTLVVGDIHGCYAELEAQLVEGSFVAEEVDDLEHLAPLRFGVVEPGEGG